VEEDSGRLTCFVVAVEEAEEEDEEDEEEGVFFLGNSLVEGDGVGKSAEMLTAVTERLLFEEEVVLFLIVLLEGEKG
jgi:hypothetical protein